MINKTLHTKPTDGSTHWSTRGLASETGISKSTVARYLQLFQLKPHRVESFKLSTDPLFVEKLRDVVGLYPQAVRTDQGPEFTSRAFTAWAQAKGVRHILNQPGKPTQNAYIESFSSKFRHECSNGMRPPKSP
ncbi:transposase InsO family protein [Pseudacidovorax sp. 1753]